MKVNFSCKCISEQENHGRHFDFLIRPRVRGGVVVEALRYKLEGRGFDFRWCRSIFSFTYSFRPHYGPGVDSASNRNEYQEYFLGV
jgi:hypothetical protein